MRKREYDRLVGMWVHPKGGYEIKYQLNGKMHYEYRQDKKEAQLRADYWKATLNAPKPENPSPEEPASYEHTVLYWDRILRRAAELALLDLSSKDVANTCRALAAMAQAAMRTAKYIPAPDVQSSPDATPITGDISSLTTEEMEALLNGKPTSPSDEGER